MTKEKIYKKGTVITMHSCCNYTGCDETEKRVLVEDMTESQLQADANEYAMENVQPEGWFTEGAEDDND